MSIEGACRICGKMLRAVRVGTRDTVHEPGGQSCRVFLWEQQAAAQDLIRVNGEVSVELTKFGVDPVYGPVFDFQHKFTSGAFAPRWAVYLQLALPFSNFGRLDTTAVIARARADESFRSALLTLGDMFEVHSERRAALIQFLDAESDTTAAFKGERNLE